MDTLFRVLYRHLRVVWLRARSLFLSIRFYRLRTSTSTSSTTTVTRTRLPLTPMSPASISTAPASRAPASSTARAKASQWACRHASELKVQMKERRAAARQKMMMMMMRRAVSTHVAATVGLGQMKGKEVAAGAGATSECRAAKDVVEEEEDEEDEANEGEDREEETEEPRGEGEDDLDAFEALFKSLSSSSPALHFDAHPPFSPSLSLRSRASTPGPLTPILPEPEFRLELDLGHALPSPAISSVSSRSYDTSAPATPTSPLGFPSTHHTVDEAAPVAPRLHLRPRSHPRAQFRSLSASITARSPLSFSFPLSLSLPLAGRRASSLGTGMHRYMVQQNDGRAGAAAARVAGEDGEEVGEGEDPFGTHGGAYYTPGAREALVLGDAYDLTAWAWACDCSPYRRTKKRKRHVQASPITKASGAAIADAGDDAGTTMKGGNRSGSVYCAPIHAASAPQLSCAQRPDRELEYLQALANATARGRVPRPPAPVHVSTRNRAPGYRSGIRPLLLPQKLGLPGSGAPAGEMDMAKVLVSGGRERKATGWELDLERGVNDRRHVAKV